ncbi:hypothetical protein PR048_026982 [Dryococelus australis]|uniref:Uncharacterized protein n=1 Tax=Dryococelus australis TaxID=614101 RepID=A0ABQ9GMU7_9NEOP|nr:hypothetical protein PR048_026982 [Dryococelus australis]
MLYALEQVSFLHWLLRTCEATPFLTEQHVIGAHNCAMFSFIGAELERPCQIKTGPMTNMMQNPRRMDLSAIPAERKGEGDSPSASTSSMISCSVSSSGLEPSISRIMPTIKIPIGWAGVRRLDCQALISERGPIMLLAGDVISSAFEAGVRKICSCFIEQAQVANLRSRTSTAAVLHLLKNDPTSSASSQLSIVMTVIVPMAAVVQWLGRSPPTTVIQARSSACLLPDFRMWESCSTMPLEHGFLVVLPVSPALALQRRSILGSHLIAGMKGRGKREIPEKTRRPTASSGTIPTYKNPVTRPGIEPVRNDARLARSFLPHGTASLKQTSFETENGAEQIGFHKTPDSPGVSFRMGQPA